MHVCTHLHMNIGHTLITFRNTTHIWKCTHPFSETYMKYAHTHTCTLTQRRTHTHHRRTHAHICTHTYVRTHAHTQWCTRTHTQTHMWINFCTKGTQRCRGTPLAGNPGTLLLQELDQHSHGSLETFTVNGELKLPCLNARLSPGTRKITMHYSFDMAQVSIDRKLFHDLPVIQL